jgi:hypothetical protein
MSKPAGGVRVAWDDIPATLQAAIEEVCGASVAEAMTQPGGFSPGVAARVRCADGARWFVKAVSAEANRHSPLLHRREAQNLAALDPIIAARRLPIPRLRGTAILCALAGYFTSQALLPPPPGLPTVRAFQAAQGQVARRWLADFL